jgi:galactokinase
MSSTDRVVIASSPGRVNLIGEHIDYNDGWVLPFAIRERTRVRVATSHDPAVSIRSKQQGDEIRLPLDQMRPENRRNDWSDYVAGTIWSLATTADFRERVMVGLDIEVDGQVPLGAGLSSSAALECSLAFALNHLFDLQLDLATLARVAQRGENEYVGMPCGIMDQAVSLMAKKGHALLLDCVDLSTRHVPFDLTPEGLQILVIDTMAHHELIDGGYKERRDTCHRTLRQLGFASMRDLDLNQLELFANSLDPIGFRRIRHAVTEISRVHEMVSALDSRDFMRVGAILDASHASLRDDYEVSCSELDLAVEVAKKCGALGARMVGGGFGGSAIALIESAKVSSAEDLIRSAFSEKGFAAPRFFIATAEEGSRIEKG